MSKKINYIARNFAETRSELIDLIKQYYPNLLSDFNDASVASLFVDLNSAVTDLLFSHIDKTYQETQIDYATQKMSLLNLARTMGVKVSGKHPSVTICDFRVTVPVKGSTYDKDYAPVLKRGTRVSGNGRVFELSEDVDFNNPFSESGIPNRLLDPNINPNGIITSYDIVKREVVQNGESKVYKRVIGVNDTKSFFNIILTEQNILNIDSIILLDGTNYTDLPDNTKFYANDDTRWYEMDALIENKVFVENGFGENNFLKGKWKATNNRFITEYTGNGLMKITFGGGNIDISNIYDSSSLHGLNVKDSLKAVNNIINNNSLGTTLSTGKTLFIKYKVGGGTDSNVSTNTINTIVALDMGFNGSDYSIISAVENSLRVNNPIPALGGKDNPSIEEIRNLIKYNFASQNRAVVIKDYYAIISRMSGKYGAPYKIGVMEDKNKIVINILSKDENNKLTEKVSSVLKENIVNFIEEYRMINDYVIVKSGKVVNIGLDIDVMINNSASKTDVVSSIIKNVTEFFNTDNLEMGENIYMSKLMDKINSITGILNVVNIVVKNKINGEYSKTISPQSVMVDDEYIIDFDNDYTIYNEIDTMLEIKNPSIDIRCRIK